MSKCAYQLAYITEAIARLNNQMPLVIYRIWVDGPSKYPSAPSQLSYITGAIARINTQMRLVNYRISRDCP